MRKVAIILLSSIGLLSATSGTAFSGQQAVNIFKGGSGPSTSKVRIFLPSHNQPPADSEQQQPIKIAQKTVVTYTHYREHETRVQRRKRAIGHRYLGFVKQYRGYRYPF